MLGDKPQQELDATKIKLLHEAAALYQDDLLPGWYQDWCLYERERLQNMYQLMLDKLMGYCEAHQEYETGIIYGQQILRFDRASERTHQRLMRLHYLAGDRTAALRQYERCLTALRDDLDVKPAKATMALCEQIRTDNLDGAPSESARAERASSTPATLPEVLGHLKRLRLALSDIQRQVQQDIQALEVAYTTTTDSEDPAKVQRATAALSK
jgi:DNA-binding SARP family transcriptional activator